MSQASRVGLMDDQLGFYDDMAKELGRLFPAFAAP